MVGRFVRISLCSIWGEEFPSSLTLGAAGAWLILTLSVVMLFIRWGTNRRFGLRFSLFTWFLSVAAALSLISLAVAWRQEHQRRLLELTLVEIGDHRKVEFPGGISKRELGALRYVEMDWLVIANDKLDDKTLNQVARLSNLQKLELTNCDLRHCNIALLQALPHLCYLSLNESCLNDRCFVEIGAIGHLRRLSLVHTNVAGSQINE